MLAYVEGEFSISDDETLIGWHLKPKLFGGAIRYQSSKFTSKKKNIRIVHSIYHKLIASGYNVIIAIIAIGNNQEDRVIFNEGNYLIGNKFNPLPVINFQEGMRSKIGVIDLFLIYLDINYEELLNKLNSDNIHLHFPTDENMIDPIEGICYYNALQHQVEEKMFYRNTGNINSITKTTN
ncbi:hypothetical protein BCR32DRAFT_275904 [Anaeromyces robustus]|uniref:Uncharacterized protein n=1 Tax=Anaeromyces robustus TaxID=1754192 RepID=A0A1Y1XK43_9FUNG|nr:hypothetical protein BCR32DRAFT_275904 [Anaeromyces robustus]|eukprot:ORX85826.1 hypothetical protein BCR32DRAFT_275904 [Anaeromyces robustus]